MIPLKQAIRAFEAAFRDAHEGRLPRPEEIPPEMREKYVEYRKLKQSAAASVAVVATREKEENEALFKEMDEVMTGTKKRKHDALAVKRILSRINHHAAGGDEEEEDDSISHLHPRIPRKAMMTTDDSRNRIADAMKSTSSVTIVRQSQSIATNKYRTTISALGNLPRLEESASSIPLVMTTKPLASTASDIIPETKHEDERVDEASPRKRHVAELKAEDEQDLAATQSNSDFSYARRTSSTTITSSRRATSKAKENFVRMNLKGGWRPKPRKGRGGGKGSFFKSSRFNTENSFLSNDGGRGTQGDDVIETALSLLTSATSDTVTTTTTTTTTTKTPQTQPQKIPKCHHDSACVERVVKKASTGNKGRKFYACAFGREGGCGFFMWVDDTKDEVVKALSGNGVGDDDKKKKTTPRARLDVAKMTVPELKQRLEALRGAEGGAPPHREEDDDEVTDSESSSLSDTSSETSEDDEDDEERPKTKTKAKSRTKPKPRKTPMPKGKEALKSALLETWARKETEADELREELARQGGLSEDNAEEFLERVLRRVFGHSEFLAGQKDILRRLTLRRESMLVIRPTGSGKSLLYQLPTFLSYPKSITIVVSPLISLMQDQLAKLPPGMRGSSLSSNQSAKEQAEIVREIGEGMVDVLFVAPERFVTSSFVRMVCDSRACPRNVGMVCVDEAHCLSSWSHNFRPSYLRLRDVISTIRARRGGESSSSEPNSNRMVVLALTATATLRVAQAVREALGLSAGWSPATSTVSNPSEGFDGTTWMRHNLKIEIKLAPAGEDLRIRALLSLLATDSKRDSTKPLNQIVYSSTKHETEVLAERISASFASSSSSSSDDSFTFASNSRSNDSTRGKKSLHKKAAITAKSYHAGMTFHQRKEVQSRFIRGSVNIVVATVAFGMGLDKSDVDRVVHYRTPKSIEDYVQEIGRAGRDGRTASCVCFFDKEGADLKRSLSLCRSDGVERVQIQKMMAKMSKTIAEAKERRPLVAHPLLALEMEAWTRELDVKEPVLETFLVRLSEMGLMELLPSGYALAEITLKSEFSDGGARFNVSSSHFGSRGFDDDALDEDEFVRKVLKGGSREGRATTDDKTATTGARYMREAVRRAAVKRLGEGKYLARVCDIFTDADDGAESDVTPSRAIHRLCLARDNGDIVSFKLQGLAWFVRWCGETAASLSEGVVDELQRQADELEMAGVDKINSLYHVMRVGLEDTLARERKSLMRDLRQSPGVEGDEEEDDDVINTKDDATPSRLHALISIYFEKGTLKDEPGFRGVPVEEMDDYARRTIKMDLESLIDDAQFSSLSSHLRTSRALARILHGVTSVRYSYDEWGMHPLWGRHAGFDFDQIKALATEVLQKRMYM